jgi:hypothetical protein
MALARPKLPESGRKLLSYAGSVVVDQYVFNGLPVEGKGCGQSRQVVVAAGRSSGCLGGPRGVDMEAYLLDERGLIVMKPKERPCLTDTEFQHEGAAKVVQVHGVDDA